MRAFLDDPACAWVFQRRDERRASLRACWTAILEFMAIAGVVETTPDLSGAACWLPPMGRGNTLLAGGPTIWIMVRDVGAGPVRNGDRV